MTIPVVPRGRPASGVKPEGAENRRSVRLPLSIAVEMSYSDPQGQARLERTHTLSIDRNGARILTGCFHPIGKMIHLALPSVGRSAHCRVVWCSAPAHGGYEIGVEMTDEGNVWGVDFGADRAPANGDLAALVRILEEKGMIAPGEFEARR